MSNEKNKLEEVEKIRLKYDVLSDSTKVPNNKIILALEEANMQATLDGLGEEALILGSRHLATYKLLLDIGLIKKHTRKEDSEEKFDNDPAKAELKLYQGIVKKYNDNKLKGSNFINFLSS